MNNMDRFINQFPEQEARDNINKKLNATGWAVQDKNKINCNESNGIAIRGYQTDFGLTDYVLLVERRPVGIIEAKKEEEGCRITSHELQAEFYTKDKLKYLDNDPLSFVYESDRNLNKWVFEKQAGALKFNEKQMNWLRMMKEYIAASFHIEVEDLDYTPFNAYGGCGMMFQLLGTGMNTVSNEMNEALVV